MPVADLYLVNNSSITLHVFAPDPGTGFTPHETTILPATTARIGTAQSTSTLPAWGWVVVGRTPTDPAFQVFWDFGTAAAAPSAALGLDATARTRTAPNPDPLAPAIASAAYEDPDFIYTFNGEVSVVHLRLNTTTQVDAWEQYRRNAAGSYEWALLTDDEAACEIDAATTTVCVAIANACTTDFFVDIAQQTGGSLHWLNTAIDRDQTESFRIPTSMVATAQWSFTISGEYRGPRPGDQATRKIPDPVFKITRSGGASGA